MVDDLIVKPKLQKRTFLGSPLEQLNELGRSIKNLASLDHYRAIPKFIGDKKEVYKGHMSWPMWAISAMNYFNYSVLGNPFFGLMGVFTNPVVLALKEATGDIHHTLSLKKDDLESLLRITEAHKKLKGRPSFDFQQAFNVFTRNEFDASERKEMEHLLSNNDLYYHYPDKYFSEMRPELAEFKDAEIRALAFKNFLISGSIGNKKNLKIIEQAPKSTGRDLALILARNNPAYLHESTLNFFLSPGLREADKAVYQLAIESGVDYSSHFKSLKRIIEKNDSDLVDSLVKYMARNKKAPGVSNTLDNLSVYYGDYTENPQIKSLTELVLTKGAREILPDTLQSLRYMASTPEGIETAELVNSYGKKKKLQLIRRMTPLIKLYGLESIGIINKAIKQDGEVDILQFFDSMNEHIKNYFQIQQISPSLTKKDISYLLNGYNANRSNPESRQFIGSVLRGDSLWSYRESFSKEVLEELDPKWLSGFKHEVTKKVKLDVKSEEIAYENYAEAIAHLQEDGMDIELRTDYRAHATELLEKITQTNKTLVNDAREHLQRTIRTQKDTQVEVSKITYRTGNLRDFAFIGEYPQQTCLGLGRSNSKYTIGMAKNANILPFIVSAEHEDKEVVLKRGFLRCSEDKLIIDDLYGPQIDFLKEVAKFACSLGREIVIPEAMMTRLTEEDQNYIKKSLKKREISEYFKEPIYSDSARSSNRGNVECKYEAYLGEPCALTA